MRTRQTLTTVCQKILFSWNCFNSWHMPVDNLSDAPLRLLCTAPSASTRRKTLFWNTGRAACLETTTAFKQTQGPHGTLFQSQPSSCARHTDNTSSPDPRVALCFQLMSCEEMEGNKMSSVATRCSWYKWNLALVHYKIEEIK